MGCHSFPVIKKTNVNVLQNDKQLYTLSSYVFVLLVLNEEMADEVSSFLGYTCKGLLIEVPIASLNILKRLNIIFTREW